MSTLGKNHCMLFIYVMAGQYKVNSLLCQSKKKQRTSTSCVTYFSTVHIFSASYGLFELSIAGGHKPLSELCLLYFKD